MPDAEVLLRAGDPRALPAHRPRTSASTTTPCFQTRVTELRWDEAADALDRHAPTAATRFTARFVAMANGPLNRPKLPGIPGIDDFKGHTFHTSRWDYDYTGGDSTGGLTKLPTSASASSAPARPPIQCVPHLGECGQAALRLPAHAVVGRRAQQPPTDPDWAAIARARLAAASGMDNFNILVSRRRPADEDLVNDGWTDIFRNLTGTSPSRPRKLGRRLTPQERGELMELADYQKMNQVRARVDDDRRGPGDRRGAEALVPPVLQAAVLPRRVPADLQPARTSRWSTPTARASSGSPRHGVVVDGIEYEVDCLIFATGFEVGTTYTRRAGYDIIGRGRHDAVGELVGRAAHAARPASRRLPELLLPRLHPDGAARSACRRRSTSRPSTSPT